jgi:hypothetical protein
MIIKKSKENEQFTVSIPTVAGRVATFQRDKIPQIFQ